MVNVGGWLPLTNATIYSYGIAQDAAAQTGIGSPDIQTNIFTAAGIRFSNTFAPYSASVIVFNPAPPPQLASPVMLLGKFAFQLQGQPGARYVLQYSTNLLAGWNAYATNPLAGFAQNFTNVTSGTQQYWRAQWLP